MISFVRYRVDKGYSALLKAVLAVLTSHKIGSVPGMPHGQAAATGWLGSIDFCEF